MNKISLCILLLVLQACAQSPSPPALNTNNSPRELIPAAVKTYIQKHFNGWALVDDADYGATWWSFYDRQRIPYAVVTDINDDQRADYALLLKHNNTLQLVILLGMKNNDFAHLVVNVGAQGMQPHNLQIGLAIAPPEQIDIVKPVEQSLILASNGISLMQLENRSAVYYWGNGTLNVFHLQ